MLGKSPIQWRQRPNMTIAVDWDIKHQTNTKSFAVTVKLICAFVFAYVKCWFSHDMTQKSYLLDLYNLNKASLLHIIKDAI